MEDFAAPPAEPVGDAPIVLEPVDSGFAMVPDDQPAYLGEVDEAPAATEDAPIILGGASNDDIIPPVEANTEPTPMQKWNEGWQELLVTRKDEENSRKAELIEKSRQFMENFNAERQQKRETKMTKNREDEQAKLEAIEADLENDNSWQRVCKMVELSHDSTSKAQDVKRIRDVMIHLKNEAKLAEALS